jgi:hypothetical protein
VAHRKKHRESLSADLHLGSRSSTAKTECLNYITGAELPQVSHFDLKVFF